MPVSITVGVPQDPMPLNSNNDISASESVDYDSVSLSGTFDGPSYVNANNVLKSVKTSPLHNFITHIADNKEIRSGFESQTAPHT
ncbi:unnamed protein product [Cylicocyclus nassatus]|uniref:Uncharacterized protein n=1 Tax=Cylicocyclus nassatus TaxID=53992 RepID=A0AA36H9J1_CYLNA|nr:unnamed protein product [Cylicocyclus nassatus]